MATEMENIAEENPTSSAPNNNNQVRDKPSARKLNTIKFFY